MNLSKKHKLWLALAAVVLMIAEVKTAHARTESKCLERIGFAEAQGESVKGVQDVMNATIAHAKQLKISVCKVKAKQQTPSSDVALSYSLIAKSVLAGEIKPRNRANAWRSKGQRAKGGVSAGITGKHQFFYVAHL